MIIHRYFLKDIIKTWLAVLVVILLVAISNKVVKLMSKAALGELSPSLLFQMIGYQLPELVAFLLPLALFFAILLSLGKFSVDHEFTAFFALGGQWKRLIRLSCGLGILALVVVFFLSLYVVPISEQKKQTLLATEEPAALLQALNKGRFYSFQDDKLVFYVEDISADKRTMKQVFIAEQPKGHPGAEDDWTMISALRGSIESNQESGQTFVELHHGQRYEGVPGQQDYVNIEFEKYGKLIEKKLPQPDVYVFRAMPTQMLWGSPNASLKAELQWRISLGLTAPILALLALALGKVPPRKGRFHRLFPAIAIFIIYYNLITLSKRFIAQGSLSPWIGIWWVHGLFALITVGLLLMNSGATRKWFAPKQGHSYV